jgi:hypothetical protein
MAIIAERVCFGKLRKTERLDAVPPPYPEANYLMPSLSKEVGQEIGIGTIVKIQLEGHGRSLRA